jgi:DNA primase large subunit
LAKYPFLPQARERISQVELDFDLIVDLPQLRKLAKERVIASFDPAIGFSLDRIRDRDAEVTSYPIAILFVAAIKDRLLLERFALFEAKRINRYLVEESRQEVVLEIAKSFKWDVQTNEDYSISVHFVKYLENVSRGRLIHDPKWKLVNRRLEAGRVYVSPNELARLLQEEVQNRIKESAAQDVDNVPVEIQKDVDEIKAEFAKIKPSLEDFGKEIRAQESEYPPCITALVQRASKGQHLSHVERFTLVTYLLRQGVSVDAVVMLFSHVSDFKQEKTRYQVEHLSGKKGGKIDAYIPYNCSTLQTHGVCPKVVDPICRTINNPLTYHLRKQAQSKKTRS